MLMDFQAAFGCTVLLCWPDTCIRYFPLLPKCRPYGQLSDSRIRPTQLKSVNKAMISNNQSRLKTHRTVIPACAHYCPE